MNISDFDYFLPEKQIAQVPADPRDSSRMMVLSPKTQTIEHRHFYQLDEYLTDNPSASHWCKTADWGKG